MIEAKRAGVRQERSPEELLSNWALVDGDWDLVANKSGATRLGFSLLLKFFELEGRFPMCWKRSRRPRWSTSPIR
ncbi:hypothetical protein ACWCXX_37750 [Streptomyces sp. NPDC001732]